MSRVTMILAGVVGVSVGKFGFGQRISPPEIEWQKTFGGANEDHGHSVQQTSDGGYVVAGTSSVGESNDDVYLVKTNAEGDIVWEKNYGGIKDDRGHSVQQTSDGGYVVAGYTGTFGTTGNIDVYLIKTNAEGNIVWEKNYGGAKDDYGHSVQQTSDGGYIVVGYSKSFGFGEWYFYLIKTNTEGKMIWQKTFGGINYDYGHSVQQTSDGGYILAGTSSVGDGNWHVYLIKTNTEGNIVWQKAYGGTNRDYNHSVQQTSDGGYIVAGIASPLDDGKWYVYLVKTDAEGKRVWQKIYGGAGSVGHSVQQTSDGGYVVAGYTGTFGTTGNIDVYLIKTNAEGNIVWEKNYGGAKDDYGYSVQQTSDGGYIVVGTSSVGIGNDDVYLIKLSPETVLLPPSQVIAQLRTEQSIGLSWSYKGQVADDGVNPNNTTFVIEKKADTSAWQKIGETAYNIFKYIDTPVQPNEDIMYRVSTRNANRASDPVVSNTVKTPANARWQLKIYDPDQDKWVDCPKDKAFNTDYGTAVLIHGWNAKNGKNINDYGFQEVAKAMLTRFSLLNIVAWDWMHASKAGIDDLDRVLTNMSHEVYKFRRAFFNLIPEGYSKPIHYFGHSFGCYFIASYVELDLWAANPPISKVFPKQITLWDPADLATFITDEYTQNRYINKLTAQITGARRFGVYVDCYSGITNWTTHNSTIWVNVPFPLENPLKVHSVDRWYAQTADIAKAPLLYVKKSCFSEALDGQIGFSASILLAPPNNPDRLRVKIAQCKTTGTLKFSKLSLCKVITGANIFGLNSSQDCQIHLGFTQQPVSNFMETSLKLTRLREGQGGQIEKSASIRVPFFIDQNWDYISFEFDFTSAPEPAWLRASIDDGTTTYLLMEAQSDVVFNDEYLPSGILSMAQYQNKEVELIFTLSSNTEGSEVRLKNLTGWTSSYDRNEPPVADAGDDQTIVLLKSNITTVQLDASKSSDSEGDVLDYKWYLQGEFLASGVQPTIELISGNHIIELVVADSVDHTASDTVVIAILIHFLRGDSNSDSAVDISDAIKTLFHLFLGHTISCHDAADANDDGEIDISDAITTLTFLFIGGKEIPKPYPDTGIDTTDDTLDCQEYKRKE